MSAAATSARAPEVGTAAAAVAAYAAAYADADAAAAAAADAAAYADADADANAKKIDWRRAQAKKLLELLASAPIYTEK